MNIENILFSKIETLKLAEWLIKQNDICVGIACFAESFPDQEKIGKHIIGEIAKYYQDHDGQIEELSSFVGNLHEVDFIEVANIFLTNRDRD